MCKESEQKKRLEFARRQLKELYEDMEFAGEDFDGWLTEVTIAKLDVDRAEREYEAWKRMTPEYA